LNKRPAVLVVVISLVAMLALFFSVEINRARYLNGAGDIVAGEKFGIRIGDPANDAIETLRELNLQSIERDPQARCLNIDFAKQGLDVIPFEDQGGARGLVCLGHKDGVVARLVWSFGGWQL
jgi:hypothetical protein